MRVLFFGDIVGRLGVEAVKAAIPVLSKQYAIDFIIANGENAAKGKGITYREYEDLVEAGVDCVTLGNHFRSKKQIDSFIDDCDRLVRPYNVLRYDYGSGYLSFEINGQELVVVNLLTTVFMSEEVASPTLKMQDVIDEHPNAAIIVDFHGEATSEKAVFAHYFDGIVTAVLGTHTHVQTSDGRVLPQGTAFISDVGYCGMAESVLGFSPQSAIDVFVFGEGRLSIDEESDARVNAVVIDIDEETRLARSIETVNVVINKEKMHG